MSMADDWVPLPKKLFTRDSPLWDDRNSGKLWWPAASIWLDVIISMPKDAREDFSSNRSRVTKTGSMFICCCAYAELVTRTQATKGMAKESLACKE